jgi:DNA-binding NarL/FixJ family response regulator
MRILVVEDHSMMRTALVRELESAGGQQVTVNDASGLEQAKLMFGGCDIILTDLHLGDGGIEAGIELIRSAVERHTPIPVAVLTGFTQSQSLWRANAAGARALIAKSGPLTGAQLLDILRRVLRDERHVCPTSRAMLQAAEGTALSARHCDVIARVATGMSDDLIAEDLRISVATVRTHLRTIFRIIGVDNRTRAAHWWLGNAAAYSATDVIEMLGRVEALRKPIQRRADLAGMLDTMIALIAASTGVGVVVRVAPAAFDPPLALCCAPAPAMLQRRTPTVLRTLEWGTIVIGEAEIHGDPARQPLIDLLLRVIVETLAEVRDVEQLIRDQQRQAAGELHNSLASALLALRLTAQRVQRKARSERSPLAAEIAQLGSAAFACQQTTDELIALWSGTPGAIDVAARIALDIDTANTSIGGPTVTQHVQLPPDLAPETARRVLSIMRGLMANAYEHADAGALTLSAGRSPQNPNELEICVADDGVGFVVPEGLDAPGIGLNIISDLVDQAGGRLEVQSVPGAGTRVIVRLPMQAPSDAPAPSRT